MGLYVGKVLKIHFKRNKLDDKSHISHLTLKILKVHHYL